MAEANMNIYQKLAKIRKQVEVMKRDAKGFNYTYTTEESILAKVTVQMDKLHLSLIPSIVPESTVVIPYSVTETKTTSKGDVYDKNVNEILVQSDMVWTWVNNDNPDERIEVPWAMVGQQSDASQAFGSGLTYSSRYFLLKYFNIATSDADPDAFRKKQKAAEAEEQKLIPSRSTSSWLATSWICPSGGTHSGSCESVSACVWIRIRTNLSRRFIPRSTT